MGGSIPIMQPSAPSIAAPVIAPVIGGPGPGPGYERPQQVVVREDQPTAIMREVGNLVERGTNIYLQERARQEERADRREALAAYAPYASGLRTPAGPALDYAPDFIQPMSQSGYSLQSPLLLGGGSNLTSVSNTRRGSIASGSLLGNQSSVTPPSGNITPPVNVGPPQGSNFFTPGPAAGNKTTPKGPQSAPPILGNQNTSQGGFFTNLKKRLSNAVSPKDTTPPPVDTPSNKRSNTPSMNNAVYGSNVTPPSSSSSLANNSQQMQNERFDEQEEKKQEERPRNMMSPVLENFLNQPALGYGSPVLGSQGAGYAPNAPRVNKAGAGGAIGRYQEEEKKMEENPNRPEGPLVRAGEDVKNMPRKNLAKDFNIDDINSQINQFRSELDAIKAKREEDEARRKEAEKQIKKNANLASATKQLRENARTDRGLLYGMTPQEIQELNELENIQNNPTRYQQVLNDPKIRKAMREYSYALNLKNAQGKSKQFTSRLDTRSNPFVTN